MTRQIPWLRVFVEGVVIVGSILLAFGLQAWWEGRQEREEAHEIVVGLREEYVQHRAAIERFGDRWELHSRSVNRLLSEIRSESSPPVAAMDTMLWHVIFAGTFDPASGVRDALIASGELDLIQNPELRARLSAWKGLTDELRDNELAMRTFVLNTVFPYLARVGVSITRASVAGGREYPPSALMRDDEAEIVYHSLLRDPEFESLVSQRSGWFNASEYREAIPAVDRLLVLIDEELRRFQ